MDLSAVFAQEGVRGMVEGAAWAAGAFVGICAAVGVAWRLKPFVWLRQQITEERTERLGAAIADHTAPWRDEVAETLVRLHEQGARTEHDLEQHRAESATQHAADLERRQKRQALQDEREQAQEERLDALEHGQAAALGRLQTVERLAVTVARRVGAGDEAEEIVAENEPEVPT